MTQAAPNMTIPELLEIMARLRDKNTGCPWDIEQDFVSIAPCTIEEAYEVADAIARGDMNDVREELGDLLLQVVFHAQMAREAGLFTFDDVARGLIQKLVSRHPHVFGDDTAKSAEDVMGIWQQQKDKEKIAKGKKTSSILDDIPLNFPALLRAQKLSKKAAKAGFEWQNTSDVIDKIIEELEELRAEIHSGDKARQQEELGDVFQTLVNLARRLDIDAETAMRSCCDKFYRRFSGMEQDAAADGRTISSLTPDDWEIYWQKQKDKE